MGTPCSIDLGEMDVVIPTPEEFREYCLNQCRPIVHRIAIAAEQKMAIHDPVKGDSWKTCDIEYLEDKLREEVREYFDESKHVRSRAGELPDIVAVCAMLYARIRGGQ